MHVTVIAKTPEPGRVKTRLCPPLTHDMAAEIAAAALADTFEAIDRVLGAFIDSTHGVRRVLLLDGQPGPWVPTGYDVVAQRGDGLGERLANGFADLGPGVIVGMDTPGACVHVGVAVAAVRAGHAVLGLAEDGGYWIVGLAEPDPQVFDGIPMSCSNTGLAQIRRLHGLGHAVRLLPMTRDIDDAADLTAAHASPSGRLGVVLAGLFGS